jgi:hypothetical protein
LLIIKKIIEGAIKASQNKYNCEEKAIETNNAKRPADLMHTDSYAPPVSPKRRSNNVLGFSPLNY